MWLIPARTKCYCSLKRPLEAGFKRFYQIFVLLFMRCHGAQSGLLSACFRVGVCGSRAAGRTTKVCSDKRACSCWNKWKHQLTAEPHSWISVPTERRRFFEIWRRSSPPEHMFPKKACSCCRGVYLKRYTCIKRHTQLLDCKSKEMS